MAVWIQLGTKRGDVFRCMPQQLKGEASRSNHTLGIYRCSEAGRSEMARVSQAAYNVGGTMPRTEIALRHLLYEAMLL